MANRYPKTVEALIERIKMDACPGMGDLSSQCCASLEALENMVEQIDELKSENKRLMEENERWNEWAADYIDGGVEVSQ